MKGSDLKPAEQEQWLRKLQEMVVMRRGKMYRFIAETVRMLVFANAGGIALVAGFFPGTIGEESFHWVSLATMCFFIVGALCAALTEIFITAVTVREAHGMETALHEFSKGKLKREEVMFYLDKGTLKVANYASGFGVVSAVFFGIGCIMGVVQLVFFF